jgi:hypothetical protein
LIKTDGNRISKKGTYLFLRSSLKKYLESPGEIACSNQMEGSGHAQLGILAHEVSPTDSLQGRQLKEYVVEDLRSAGKFTRIEIGNGGQGG